MAFASSQAIVDAAQRFTMGDVPEQSRTFAPSVAEFVQEARRQEEACELRARPRLPAPSYRPGPLAPFEIARQKSFADHSHLPVLFENVGFDDWKKLSKQQQIPPGSVWVAATETVYGPPKHQQAKAA